MKFIIRHKGQKFMTCTSLGQSIITQCCVRYRSYCIFKLHDCILINPIRKFSCNNGHFKKPFQHPNFHFWRVTRFDVHYLSFVDDFGHWLLMLLTDLWSIFIYKTNNVVFDALMHDLNALKRVCSYTNSTTYEDWQDIENY